MGSLDTSTILAIMAPIIIIELALDIFAIYRLVKDRAKYMPKWAWALIIIFFNLVGAIIFLTIGREKE